MIEKKGTHHREGLTLDFVRHLDERHLGELVLHVEQRQSRVSQQTVDPRVGAIVERRRRESDWAFGRAGVCFDSSTLPWAHVVHLALESDIDIELAQLESHALL